jgi:hypothetical protein
MVEEIAKGSVKIQRERLTLLLRSQIHVVSLECLRSPFPLYVETLMKNNVSIEESTTKRCKEKWNSYDII